MNQFEQRFLVPAFYDEAVKCWDMLVIEGNYTTEELIAINDRLTRERKSLFERCEYFILLWKVEHKHKSHVKRESSAESELRKTYGKLTYDAISDRVSWKKRKKRTNSNIQAVA